MRVKVLILGLILLSLIACPNFENPYSPELPDPTDPEVLPQAILEVTTIPEIPIFTFVPSPDWDESNSYSRSQFTLVVTETEGVGGDVRIRLQWGAYYPGALWTKEGEFEPFDILSFEINLRIYSTLTISYLKVYVDGTDDNGHSFDFIVTVVCAAEDN